MKLYSGKIRLHGENDNTQFGNEMTAAEIVTLRLIHGEDAVIDVGETGEETDRSQGEEFDRLLQFYKPEIVKGAFGMGGVNLPLELSAQDFLQSEQPPLLRKPAVPVSHNTKGNKIRKGAIE